MYKINEVFETIQGEGVFTGVPAIFVRLQVCPVGCSWCDTKQTWTAEPEDLVSVERIMVKTEDSPLWTQLDADGVVDLLIKQGYTAKHVVITGGEPCIYDLRPLTAALETAGFNCQIETSGTSDILTSDNTWVTVSPKINMKAKLPVLTSALARANEVKHPVGTHKDIDQLDDLLATATLRNDVTIALQPISQKPRATELCISTCITRNWRLSIQTHKYLAIA
ncbi:pyrroloquinoline quinone biosynthesis protein [Photobacterium kishitanii]|uniref:7-carboxy-7-deazaguanine synthase n=1 Tax=Photobacterium kishitanii TaxID=318456 RepID=A0AAX0Z121_9GAMM|nr:7-carboxy-7-deazaguanine synthase QueE [Photobacterium kishitanii]KJG56725.1 pyrroloquinoline quinone biosynthesis protein [Photobacterium kishitanii]KJG62501.1 pyrroloquinoline quinone biosynthesis protein [Photobacterium kishitanii]KJG66870.1 pyrroloquinoline quinone biosynthesis protein [Photobacterium kishitanii]KJG70752.1 pyrroloquinoline quinone biosynthesis protein [Photobacterium kishitanii]PSU24419.1 7-carboxy-7-deazaguanine synthase QueE [Photobacterium kishitanii]